MRTDLDRLTPEAQELVKEIRSVYRASRWQLALSIAKRVFLAMTVILLIAGGFALLVRTDALSEDASIRDGQIAAILADLETVCRESDFKTPAAEARCVRATQNPPILPDPEPAGVDHEVLLALVRGAVAAELSSNPPEDGKAPSPQEILDIVRKVYKENPPSDGETPSDAELISLIEEVYAEEWATFGPGLASSAIAQYCSAQPGGSCEGPPGTPGTNGKDGAPGADGADGKDGDPGRGITDRYYARGHEVPTSTDRDGDPIVTEACYEVTEYTEAPTPVAIEVPRILCSPI